MNIQTCSIVVGTTACNAKCPFCVSKMTNNGCTVSDETINTRNFKKTCTLMDKVGVTTVLLTGRGEPTLCPMQITSYLEMLDNRVPFIELQTNGLLLEKLNDSIKKWHELGLNTICLSVVSHRRLDNIGIYGGDHYDLFDMIHYLHSLGFMVRLSVMLIDGIIDSMEKFLDLVEFCKMSKVEQLTVRPITVPFNWPEEDNAVHAWTVDHDVSKSFLDDLKDHLDENAVKLLSFDYGAVVYDYRGQNICLSNCLTEGNGDGNIRQIIFYPDGRLMYSWQYEGARLL